MEKGENNKYRVLIIEENKFIRKLLVKEFNNAGFETYTAKTPRKVKKYLEEDFIEFFLCVVEPKNSFSKNFDELLDILFRNKQHVIIYSGIDDDNLIAKYKREKILEYIVKSREEDIPYIVDITQKLINYKGKKVLVVDDSKITQRTLKENLETLMFKVIVADDGVEGLKALNRNPDVQLILTDYNMPNMDGFEFTLQVRKKWSKEEKIIIAVTANEDVKTTTNFLKFGANGYVSKKCTKDELNYNINNLMDVVLKREQAKKANQRFIELSKKLSKYLSPQIYEAIFEGKTDAKLESKRKKLTVFFSDIKGFTSTTENLESEELTQMLNSYLDLVTKIALKHGATIDKYIGDAVMIFFGDPVSEGTKQDAIKCVRMAMEMQVALREFRQKQLEEGVLNPFHIRCGINTGFCTVGNFGSENRIDYTIIGGAVNLAARLEASAEADEILVSEETYVLIKSEITATPKDLIKAKGISKPIQTYQINIDECYNGPKYNYDPKINKKLKEQIDSIGGENAKIQRLETTKK